MRVLVALMLVLCFGLASCGAVDDAKQQVRKRAAQVKLQARRLGERADRLRKQVAAKVDDTLARVKRALPQADADTPVPSRLASSSFGSFEDSVLENVNRYWVQTFRSSDIKPPRVKRVYVPRGRRARTACGEAADDQAAFYCPADDTIYFGDVIAKQIYDNIGDFGVAYALAHEYSHNVQQELGWFASGRKLTTVAPFELQADCMAGAWAYAVYQQGKIDDADVDEAVNTAFAVGDFDLTNPQHHGTPKERSRAWLRGYRTGRPAACRAFVPA